MTGSAVGRATVSPAEPCVANAIGSRDRIRPIGEEYV
jgi:hypothetical protein